MKDFENGIKLLNDYFGGIKINDGIVAEKSNENRILNLNGKTVIKYKDKSSFFRLLFQAVKLNKLDYTDGEYVKGLVYMLDCSRDAVINIKAIKRLIAVLVVTGYTGLSLYCEDTYEVLDEPCFGLKRGRFSIAEFKEIKQACSDLGLEFIPSVQALAHLRTIARWEPYYKGCMDCNDVLLVDSPRTYELIENMFKSLAINFKDCRVNIGFDEPFMLGRGKYLNKHGYENPELLFERHLEKVVKLGQKYGIRIVMWGEFMATFKNPQPIYENIIKKFDVQLINWCYGAFDWYKLSDDKTYQNFKNEIQPLSDKCYSYACTDWRFLGFAPHNEFAVHLGKGAMDASIDCNQQEVWLTAWGDAGAEVSPFATLPSIVYYGYKRLFGKNDDGFERYFAEIFGDVDDHYALDGANTLDEKSINTVSKTYLYNDLFLGFADRTVKGDYGKIFKAHLEKLKAIKPVYGLKYVYDTQIALLDLLIVKYNLGNELRLAYDGNDFKQLKRIAKKVLPVVIKKTEIFYKTFKAQWFYDNKPFGWEIHSSRIGSLIFRLKECKARIIDYVNGKTDCIPELDEPTLDNLGDGKDCIFLSWGELSSAGVVVDYFSFV